MIIEKNIFEFKFKFSAQNIYEFEFSALTFSGSSSSSAKRSSSFEFNFKFEFAALLCFPQSFPSPTAMLTAEKREVFLQNVVCAGKCSCLSGAYSPEVQGVQRTPSGISGARV